jgi:glycosyltransferase involved in cell wall biosynthesis
VSEGAPHLVLLVGNPVQHDARVRKTALSAASFGLRVTVVALTPHGESSEEQMGPVRVVNVRVEYLLRDRVNDLRRFHRRILFPFGYGKPLDTRAEARRRRVADVDLMVKAGGRVSIPGSPRPAASVMVRVRHRLTKYWNGARRRVVVVRSKIGRFYTGRRLMLHTPWAAGWYSHRPMGNWRRLLPEYLDVGVTLGPVLDELRPELIHANDVDMIAVASDYSDRARLDGRRVRWLYDAHEYFPGLTRYSVDRIAGMADCEKEYIGRADAVLTVSQPLAEAIQVRTGLTELPSVVLNAPSAIRPESRPRPSVRAAAGLAEDVCLLVHSGNIFPERGTVTLVQSLASLPDDVHLAIVTNAPMDSVNVQTLVEAAERGGTTDRLHFVPYVPGEQIVDYLSSATIGVDGLNHLPSHEMALTNKMFDYLQAGLPMVVSDVKAMSGLVRELGIGEVYPAGDAASMAAAVRTVLSDLDRYRKALTADPEVLRRFSWERQEETLRAVYGRLLGVELPVPVR